LIRTSLPRVLCEMQLLENPSYPILAIYCQTQPKRPHSHHYLPDRRTSLFGSHRDFEIFSPRVLAEGNQPNTKPNVGIYNEKAHSTLAKIPFYPFYQSGPMKA